MRRQDGDDVLTLSSSSFRLVSGKQLSILLEALRDNYLEDVHSNYEGQDIKSLNLLRDHMPRQKQASRWVTCSTVLTITLSYETLTIKRYRISMFLLYISESDNCRFYLIYTDT